MAQVHDNEDQHFTKRPDETWIYVIEHADHIPATVSIVSSTWTEDAGVTVSQDDDYLSTTRTGILVSGGTDEEDAIITNDILLSDGQTRSVQIMIKVRA